MHKFKKLQTLSFFCRFFIIIREDYSSFQAQLPETIADDMGQTLRQNRDLQCEKYGARRGKRLQKFEKLQKLFHFCRFLMIFRDIRAWYQVKMGDIRERKQHDGGKNRKKC